MALYNSVIVSAISIVFIFHSVSGATFTFKNKCDYTVWPGILGSPSLDTTGFELHRGSSRSFHAPTGWSGRFWGRTGCSFDDSGRGSCATGDCGSGGMECRGSGATPPATLAEFTLGTGSQDFYDVSLVDGFNLPMMVDVNGGSGACASTGCVEDLLKKCPTELRVEGGGACNSACTAFNTPQYCCKGPYASPATCTPSVYSQIFKSACPKSYSYAYDDTTSTFTCSNADYTITFCPSSGQKSSKDLPKSTGTSEGSGSDSDPGSNSNPGSESGSGAGSGSVEEAMLANGSWLANLATGDSTRSHSSSGSFQIFAVSIAAVYLITLPFIRF